MPIEVLIEHCEANNHLAECPIYLKIEIKGHAFLEENLYSPFTDEVGARVCASITSMLCGMIEIIKDFGEVELTKGYFCYTAKENSAKKHHKLQNKYSTCKYQFRHEIDYRLDTIVYTLWYLYQNYSQYFTSFTFKERENK